MVFRASDGIQKHTHVIRLSLVHDNKDLGK